jgi:hypothetical protein
MLSTDPAVTRSVVTPSARTFAADHNFGLWLKFRDRLVLINFICEDAELDPDDTVGRVFGSGPGHLVVHRCRKVTVSVTYGGVEKEVEVRPAARLRRVRAKAVEEFSIDRVDAADLVLRLPGQEQDLDLASPVVSIVAGRSCSATVDIVHAVRPQG